MRRHICHLHACLLACFYEKHPTFLTSHICFHLDNSELRKQYQSVSQQMMEQICDLETVKPEETPVKVCVIFYSIEICYRGCGEKPSFSCNHLIYPNVLQTYQWWRGRSSHRRCSVKKGVLKNFAKFHRKTAALESLFSKVAGLRLATLLKIDCNTAVFL